MRRQGDRHLLRTRRQRDGRHNTHHDRINLLGKEKGERRNWLRDIPHGISHFSFIRLRSSAAQFLISARYFLLYSLTLISCAVSFSFIRLCSSALQFPVSARLFLLSPFSFLLYSLTLISCAVSFLILKPPFSFLLFFKTFFFFVISK